MKIKKLHLTSFGKFKNEVIELKNGVNIIYGLNEAGKSTIHKFIEGMIFGFFRPHSSMRLLNDSYESYKPRMSNTYAGSMLIEFKGKELFIERNFSRSNPSLKIIDFVTGEDISKTIPNNSGTKLPDLAAFLEIDYTLYTNTISIAQMQNETTSDLSKVVVEKLSNLNTSKDENISVPNINKAIKARKDSLGTLKMKTKPHYLTKQKLETLNEELKESSNQYTVIKEHQKTISNLYKELNTNKQKIEQLKQQKSVFENEQLKKKYFVVEKLISEKKALEKLSLDFNKYKLLDEEEYREGLLIKNKIDNLKAKIADLKMELTQLDNKIKKLNEEEVNYSFLSENKIEFTELQKKYFSYNTIKNEIDNGKKEIERITNTKNNPQELLNIKEDYIKYKENNVIDYIQEIRQTEQNIKNHKQNIDNLQTRLPSTSLKILYILLIPLVIGVFLLLNYNKKVKVINNDILKKEQELNVSEEQLDENRELLVKQRKTNENILSKYNLNSQIEFEILYTENSSTINFSKANNERLKEIDSIIKTNTPKMERLEKELTFNINGITGVNKINEQLIEQAKTVINAYDNFISNQSELKTIYKKTKATLNTKLEEMQKDNKQVELLLNKNNVINFDIFKQSLNKKKELQKHIDSIKTLNIRIKDHLGNLTINDLKAKIDFDNEVAFNKEVYDVLLKDETIFSQEISKIKSEQAKYLEAIRQIEKRYREPNLIENDIVVAKKKLLTIENELQSLTLVKQTLDEVSKEISFEFAPTLNTEVSKVIKKITNNRYNDVKLDRYMDVKVFDKASNSNVSISGFSKGTIDQIYLAMRLGINKVITENINPFILDDSFVNYDDYRLKEVFNIITNEAVVDNRQIIIFSCQKRENNIMNNTKTEYNYIEL